MHARALRTVAAVVVVLGAWCAPAAKADAATKPGWVTDLIVTPGDGEVTVQWSPPPDDGGSPITGYKVVSTSVGSNQPCLTTTTTCTFTGLTNGQLMKALVFAINDVGQGQYRQSSAVAPSACFGNGAGPFPDVGASHPFCRQIEWFAAAKFASAAGDFRPSAPLSRQALAAYLYRVHAEPPVTLPATPSFTDVPASHPFAGPIEYLAASKYADGYPDGTYRPTEPVSRQAFAAVLYRFWDSPLFFVPSTPTFTDVAKNHPFYVPIEWLHARSFAAGYGDGSYRATAPVTRQAVAAMFYRMTVASF